MRFRPAASSCALLTALVLTSVVPVPVAAVAADDPPGWVVDRVRFEPTDPGGGPLTVQETGAYRGVIEVGPSAGGLAVINDVGVQDYVKGIAEVPSSWPAEALKAQAIAARTYALNAKASPSPSPWRADGADICNTDSCQVYAGLAKELGPEGAAWAAAVDDTAGQVLLYHGRPIFAEYSDSNGGHSVAGSQPYLQAIDDPDDASTAIGHWTWTAPLAALAPLLEVAPPLVLTGVSRQEGAIVFAVVGPDGVTGQGQMSADEFRSRVNAALPTPPALPSPLPAADYTVTGEGDTAAFEGGGWGHGVGMSQEGALVKAQRGMSADEILATYYGGITPQTLGADEMAASIRVEVASGRGSVTVAPDHYFRVVSGSGTQIGGIERGAWRVVPADGGVRVIPPEGREALALKKAVVDPPGSVNASPVVHYDLNAPAVVTVRYVTPAGVAGEVPARLVDVGEVAEPLPPPAGNGDYRVVIEAVAGPDSNVSAPLQVRIGAPGPGRSSRAGRVTIEAAGAGRTPVGRDRGVWIALALVLALSTGLSGYRV
ncbi:MAG: SpoIID/LytB domain-containing protein, partial [Actinomycetota bacterium]|nr:SpoIID/LytB domain-containing protein [Actinomycetota bacterium]